MKDRAENEKNASDRAEDEEVADENSVDDVEGQDDDGGEPVGGFDPEQRRFLWRITTTLILAVVGASLLNIAYEEHNRSHERQILQLTDDHDAAAERLNMAKQNDANALVQATLQGDKVTADQALNDLLSAFHRERETNAALRHEQGLNLRASIDDETNRFGEIVMSRVDQQVAEIQRRSRPTSGPTSGPASGPSATTTTPGPVAPPQTQP